MPTLGEFGRIDRFFKPLAHGFAPALGLDDDAGLLQPAPGRDLVVTTDALVESVHFLTGTEPAALARKALRVNLSDLAAMGAEPSCYTLALALRAEHKDDWLSAFAEGLQHDQSRYGIRLLGGDSVSTPGPVTVSVTALGTVETGRALRRSGARPGDRIWVSGTVGDGALGLVVARGEAVALDARDGAFLARRYHEPEPRLALGAAIVGLATAALDLSDGLPGDIAHLCRASGVGAVIDVSRLPLSAAARALLAEQPDLERAAFAGGDDYELLFTIDPAHTDRLIAVAKALEIGLTPIGEVVAGSEPRFVDGRGQPVAGLRGWQHF